MPDLATPPLRTLPRAELLARLRSYTNLRTVHDPASDTRWKIEVGPFPGWGTVPSWAPCGPAAEGCVARPQRMVSAGRAGRVSADGRRGPTSYAFPVREGEHTREEPGKLLSRRVVVDTGRSRYRRVSGAGAASERVSRPAGTAVSSVMRPLGQRTVSRSARSARPRPKKSALLDEER